MSQDAAKTLHKLRKAGDYIIVHASPLYPVTVRVREPNEGPPKGPGTEMTLRQQRTAQESAGSGTVALPDGTELSDGQSAVLTARTQVRHVAGAPSIELTTLDDGVETFELDSETEPFAVAATAEEPKRIVVLSGGPVFYRTVAGHVGRLPASLISEDAANSVGDGVEVAAETWLKAGAAASVEVSAA